MTENKRFIKIFEDEVFYITDTKEANKTLEDFIKNIKEEYLDNNVSYTISIVEEIAKEEYNEYLYENSMTTTEIINKLNNYEKVNQALEEKTNELYYKALENLEELNILEIAIEKVKKDYESVPIVQEAIEKIIMRKRELKSCLK